MALINARKFLNSYRLNEMKIKMLVINMYTKNRLINLDGRDS